MRAIRLQAEELVKTAAFEHCSICHGRRCLALSHYRRSKAHRLFDVLNFRY